MYNKTFYGCLRKPGIRGYNYVLIDLLNHVGDEESAATNRLLKNCMTCVKCGKAIVVLRMDSNRPDQFVV